MRLLLLCLALVVPPSHAQPAAQPDDAVFGPMQAEMARSLTRLHEESFGPPYFLAYRLEDIERYEVTASFGATVSDSKDHVRHVFVEARYGDRHLDNTDLSYHGWSGRARAGRSSSAATPR